MSKRVVEYSIFDNHVICIYDDYHKAAESAHVHPITMYLHIQCKRGVKAPRRESYFRYEGEPPEPHKVYDIYDLDFNKLKTYYNIATLSDDTGIDYSCCLSQLKNNRGKELYDRVEPHSGLYIVERVVE